MVSEGAKLYIHTYTTLVMPAQSLCHVFLVLSFCYCRLPTHTVRIVFLLHYVVHIDLCARLLRALFLGHGW